MGPRHTKDDGLRQRLWSMAAFGSWQLANDGARTNGGGIVGDITLTQASSLLAIAYDHGTTSFESIANTSALTGWTSDYQLSADAANEEAGTDGDGETDGDAVYFGNTVPFAELAFDLGTVGVNAARVWRWEYYNGTQWNQIPTASFFDNTDAANQDGEQSFERDGAVSFIPPSDWSQVAVNGSTAYFVRARVVAEQITTTPVMNTVVHDLVTPGDGFIVPAAGTITGLRVIDGTTSTLHTGTDVKFILMDFTTGAHSGELTWAQDQRQDGFTGLTLAVNRGDELGVLVTQEDSGNDDPTNVMLELQVSIC